MAGNGELLLEDAQIVFKNFTGKEGQYNREGDRNFCLLLDDELAATMAQDGWNIKELRAREEGDTPQKYIQVSVKYRGRDGAAVRPPRIVLITSRGRTDLDEDASEIIDQIDIANVDLIVRPYEWAVNGKHGVKAYLKALYVTMAEDALMRKYEDVPELGGGTPVLELEAGSDPNIIDGEGWEVDEDGERVDD